MHIYIYIYIVHDGAGAGAPWRQAGQRLPRRRAGGPYMIYYIGCNIMHFNFTCYTIRY